MDYGASICIRRTAKSGLSRRMVRSSTDASRRPAIASRPCSKGDAQWRILLEASTESEWVAQHLETFGHTVIVADPTFAPMYSERSRRVKPIAAMSPRWPTRVSGCRSWCGAGAAAARS